jgi:flagellar basal body-associated protein FliL
MENYTPLNVKKIGKESGKDKTNTVLIIIAILTACVLAFILILLIRQRMNPAPQQVEQSQEDQVPAPPVENLDEEATPSPEFDQDQMTSTPTGSLEVTPIEQPSPSFSPSP